MSLSLKNNLRLGLGLSLLLLFITSIASYTSIVALTNSTNMVIASNERLSDINDVLSIAKDAETGQRGYLLTGNNSFLQPYIGSREKALSTLDKIIAETTDDAFLHRKLKELRSTLVKRFDILDNSINLKPQNSTLSNELLITGKAYMDNAREIISEIKQEEKRLSKQYTADAQKLSEYTPLLTIIASISAILVTIFFYRRVIKGFEITTSLHKQLEEVHTETEERINGIQNLAAQISSGNYEIRMSDEKGDGLGILSGSLNKMAQSLQTAFTKLENKEWMQSGIAKLNEKMVGEQNIEILTAEVLREIVDRTKSIVGAFYLVGEDQLLHLTASVSLKSSLLKQTLLPGEGLVGEVLKSGQILQINDIKQNELTVSYATGETKPRNILAFPILRDKNIIGVIEVGSLNEYAERKIAFVKEVAHNIGIAIFVAQNHKKMQNLLEETQAQAEELQVQHVELEKLNEELEVQTHRLQSSEEELRVQQEELLQSNQELEERTGLLEERNELIREQNIRIKEKAEQLEQSTRYKSEFLSNMSHELRTPLNSILLLSGLMSESDELNPEFQEYSSVINSSGHGLLSLIDEILDLSKIEAGKMTLEIEEICINDIIKDLKGLFMPVAKSKDLELAFDVDENVGQFISDRMRLEQILKNLLSNALKFTSSGKVGLSIKHLQDQHITFSVYDTGIGIPKEKQSLIFDAFQQADGSTRRKFGGTGLGLSISKQLAKLLGGDIDLQSEENMGSKFTLTLPNIYKESTEPSAIYPLITDELTPVPQSVRLTTERIPNEIEDDRASIQDNDKVVLIIEDDTDFAQTLLKFTRQRKYKGIVAVRGDLGIEMAQKYEPVAILLDIQLPVKDGWEVMEALKSNPKTRHIPVHIMSSLEARKESLQKGAVDFINKPFALEHMKDMFEKLEETFSKNPKKVLIVEENEQHAKALSQFLSQANIHTTVTNSIQSSINELQKREINCVVLDMGIPDKTAFEALESIKKTEGLEGLPIIIFTGKNLSKGEENRIQQYADSFVVKTAHSYQRILDETAIFLHLVEEKTDENGNQKASLNKLQDVLVGKTVLIADDDMRNIFSLTRALESHKMNVVVATDGNEALKALKEHKNIDIILMDMMMPEADGYEATRTIRKDDTYKNIPIIAVTAKAMLGDREKCIEAGASDYISKPVDIDQLTSLLRVWLYESI